MLIILSSQYINAEMASQFGRLPPTFLPIGSYRFYELQLSLAGLEPVLMSLPTDYSIPQADRERLEALNVTILRMPIDLTLTEVMGRVLACVPAGEDVRLLFGDTFVELVSEAAPEPDLVAIQSTVAEYPWMFARRDETGTKFFEGAPLASEMRQIVCGYFQFSDPELLRGLLATGSLSQALTAYAAERQLALVEAREWYDFGHLTLFYQSRRDLLVARDFNELRSNGYSLLKTSDQLYKIRAEAQWYERLPKQLSLYTPRYIGYFEHNHQAGYELEYLYSPTLCDLLVFGNLSLNTWRQILSRSFDFLDACQSIRPEADAPEASGTFAAAFHRGMIVDKTWSRLRCFCAQRGVDEKTEFTLDGVSLPPLRCIVDEILAAIPQTTPDHIRFWHGDLFFGNMFYDFNAQRVIVIDPRGLLHDGGLSLFGDWRYDLGKLAHSILGLYDYTISGRSRVVSQEPFNWSFETGAGEEASWLAEAFLDQAQARFDIDGNELYALAAMMFFSMLPLHAENPARQDCLLASGLRLYRNSKDNLT